MAIASGHGTAAALLALLALGCSGGRPARTDLAPTNPAPLTSDPPVVAGRTAGSRVIVVVEENHSIDQIIGSLQAPFLNRLAAKGALLSSYFAITHPSLPNYIAMVSGDTRGITSDCGDCNVDAPNLADQLESAGISWKAYMEDLPAPCSDAHRAGAYAKKHDPFMYFASVATTTTAAPRSSPSTSSTPTFRLDGCHASCSSLPTRSMTCTGPAGAATTLP